MLPSLAQIRYETLLNFFITSVQKGKKTVIIHSETPTEITLDDTLFPLRIGRDISEKEIKDILHRLGFGVVLKKQTYTITVPSWRDTGDISIPADIVEEVARHV